MCTEIFVAVKFLAVKADDILVIFLKRGMVKYIMGFRDKGILSGH